MKAELDKVASPEQLAFSAMLVKLKELSEKRDRILATGQAEMKEKPPPQTLEEYKEAFSKLSRHHSILTNEVIELSTTLETKTEAIIKLKETVQSL